MCGVFCSRAYTYVLGGVFVTVVSLQAAAALARSRGLCPRTLPGEIGLGLLFVRAHLCEPVFIFFQDFASGRYQRRHRIRNRRRRRRVSVVTNG